MSATLYHFTIQVLKDWGAFGSDRSTPRRADLVDCWVLGVETLSCQTRSPCHVAAVGLSYSQRYEFYAASICCRLIMVFQVSSPWSSSVQPAPMLPKRNPLLLTLHRSNPTDVVNPFWSHALIMQPMILFSDDGDSWNPPSQKIKLPCLPSDVSYHRMGQTLGSGGARVVRQTASTTRLPVPP